MSASNQELSTVENLGNLTALSVFKTEAGVEPLISAVEKEVRSFVPDLTTDKGRKAVASIAAKVSRSKTALDGMGKDLVSGIKAEAKLIDAERKTIRDRFDALRDEARKPLTDWESEQKAIEEAKAAELAAAELQKEKDAHHEIAILLNEKFDREAADAKAEAERLAKEKAEAAEKARIEREAKIAADAKAKSEAESQAKIEASKAAAAKAEQDKLLAEAKAKAAAIAAAEKAEADKLAAVKAEQEKQAAEAKKEAEEAAKREADKAHYKSVMGAAKQAFISLGISDELATAAVKAIKSDLVPNVSIKF